LEIQDVTFDQILIAQLFPKNLFWMLNQCPWGTG